MTDISKVSLRDHIARIIMLDHLQLLHDFDVDGDLYRKDPECADSAYVTADNIIAALPDTKALEAELGATDMERAMKAIQKVEDNAPNASVARERLMEIVTEAQYRAANSATAQPCPCQGSNDMCGCQNRAARGGKA